jgi:hypothetical protein
MGKLHQLGLDYGSDKATYHNYCDFYEEQLKGMEPTEILEIGVLNGASLKMWKGFFPKAMVTGIDIATPKTIMDCEVWQIDATDVYHLEDMFHEIMFDIIIDDGSHMCKDQQIAFQYLYHNKLNSGGVYVMEDVHTSFFPMFCNSKHTTYELLKAKFPDAVEFWNRPDKSDSGTMIIRKP